MTLCGRLECDPGVAQDLFRELGRRETKAEFLIDNRQMILSAIWGRSAQNRLHIDFIDKLEYDNWDQSAEAVPIEQLQEAFDRISGIRIVGTFFGRYRIPTGEIFRSSIINYSKLKIDYAGMSLASTGGEFALAGAPIESFSWRSSKDLKHITVDVKGKVDHWLDDAYLTDAQQIIEKVLGVLVFRESGDDKL